ncbi:DUF6807 domain-containing protein [Tautonia plasticadhaerens]|uniref:Methane oxygenase PmoA n=1 Tax=Tautonia plasticadhaerens TaxID=2527974 RepID=A0A518GXR6_9BACT|nr:PmoA family protein [Tautonia plasticadhaerens]QDV33375.1 hypothetical protein ElP_12460 [Tautonia plasticadhaerens]
MRRAPTPRSGLGGLAVALFVSLGTGAAASPIGQEPGIELAVDAGRFDRRDTPMQISIRADEIPDPLAARLRDAAGPGSGLVLREVGRDEGGVVAQVDVLPETPDEIRVTWILPGATGAGTARVFTPDFDARTDGPTTWSLDTAPEGHLELSNRGKSVFRYNTRPVSHPDHPEPNQPRDAYIHPAFSPSGQMVTGDYSAESHPHHRGFFLAYTKTEVGDLHPDFWNIQGGSGKVHFDRLGDAKAGPVTARFSTYHRWEASRPGGEPVVVLRERWDVEAFDIPGSPYWLIDLTSSQQAEARPMVLPPYRYGGMAYRGPDSFFPEGVLDVLTSEGLGRVQGDQQPARWVDLTGPIVDGSEAYAGAAIFDHPSNVNHPTPARIHPTRLPFFCFVPGHDTAVTIGTDAPTVFRYRILIHDGRPDGDLNDRLWDDFAEPPEVTVTVANP